MEQADSTFRYLYSSSLEQKVMIKIGTLEGLKHKPDYEKLLEDPLMCFSGLYVEQCPSLMVRLQLYNNGEPFGLPVTTSYKSFSKRYNWNEWVYLPHQFNDLPRTAMLAITILDCAGAGKTTCIGGTTISLFGKNGMFRQGMFDLRVWIDVEADGNLNTTTPGKGKDLSKNQMQRLAKLAKKHRNGQIPKVDWLDRLTFREIEVINEKEKTESDYLYLLIEFPTIVSEQTGQTYSIIYFEPDGDQKYSFISKPKLVTVPDTEILQENLVERKHHRLARSARSGLSDRDAKPTANARDQLHTIVYRYPPTTALTSEEQDLVWKFRFYLTSHKKALTKFLKCINWETSSEVRQALSLMAQWVPMDVEDALELLSPAFTHPVVRRYAISRLKQAPDEDLVLYLLQLVQALKYENFDDIDEAYKRVVIDNDAVKSMSESENVESSFSSSEVNPIQSQTSYVRSPSLQSEHSTTSSTIQATSIAITSKTIDKSLPPYDESKEALHASMTTAVMGRSTTKFSSNGGNHFNEDASDISNTLISDASLPSTCNLATFLIHRASRNPTLSNYLYWYLFIECENQDSIRKQDEKVKAMYDKVLKMFKQTLMSSAELKQIKANLDKQQVFIEELVKLVKCVAKESGNRKKKCEKFQQLLGDSDTFRINFSSFEAIPLPLDPDIFIKGIIPMKVSLFKSALMPSKLTFITNEGKEYVAIFKYGDDLRQDQLILQMITLMDKLLRRENLDLKLTPYRVLATSSKHGFMQFIDSVTVAEVLATEGSIHNFFRKHYPCESGPYGISPDVMDTYIRSCAGYCVITYLLGVGDRHLDNLLLSTSGKLFHIDFGYILGRDPKPMPPPMKLSKEMVEAMGGVTSDHHHEFRKQCYTAFLHLRRHANVMLNLFALMVDASVPDIALEPDKAVKKVEENLKLGLTDEEAVQHLQNLLDLSITAVMPALVEQIHKLAQYWRK